MASFVGNICRVCLVRSDILHSVWDMCGDQEIADLMRKVLEVWVCIFSSASFLPHFSHSLRFYNSQVTGDERICCKCLRVLEEANSLRRLAVENDYVFNIRSHDSVPNNFHHDTFQRHYTTAVPYAYASYPSTVTVQQAPFQQQYIVQNTQQFPSSVYQLPTETETYQEIQTPATNCATCHGDTQGGTLEDCSVHSSDDEELRSCLRSIENVNSIELSRYHKLRPSSSFKYGKSLKTESSTHDDENDVTDDGSESDNGIVYFISIHAGDRNEPYDNSAAAMSEVKSDTSTLTPN